MNKRIRKKHNKAIYGYSDTTIHYLRISLFKALYMRCARSGIAKPNRRVIWATTRGMVLKPKAIVNELAMFPVREMINSAKHLLHTFQVSSHVAANACEAMCMDVD